MRINGSVIFLVGKFGGSENSSYLCRRNDINSIGMCNYNIAIDEAVMEEVRPSITEGMEENAWVQLQVEMLFSRMAAKAKMVKPHQQMLSKRPSGRLLPEVTEQVTYPAAMRVRSLLIRTA